MINRNFVVKEERFGKDKNQVVVVDDFLSNPEKLRNVACESEFRASAMLRQRKGYPGVRAPFPVDAKTLLSGEIEDLVRREFALSDDLNPGTPKASFSLMTVPERELGPYQTIPHFDTSKRHFFAALLYLCDEGHGGTGFYRHNSSGFESVLPETSEEYLDHCHEELNSKVIRKRYFSESDDYYTKIGFVPAKFNRLIIYRGALLHSANITSLESLNPDPSAGRLTANLFVDFQ